MKSHRGGFTLIELMIVVAIIALIAVIALPSFLRARQRAQNTKFINALRVASGAFDTYAIEHGSYPPDAFRSIVPQGMDAYFNSSLDFTAPTPIGGLWDWDKDVLTAISSRATFRKRAVVATATFWNSGSRALLLLH